MRGILPILILSGVFIFCACEKNEDILPSIPTTLDTPAAVVIAEVPPVPQNPDTTKASNADTIKTPVDKSKSSADAALYQYEKFGEMPYRILFPKNYDSTQRYPVFIFLHGIGERGNDNEIQLTWGASLFQTDSVRSKYKAIIIFPQCPRNQYWADDWGTRNLKGLIESLLEKYLIEKNKIYIGGLSMGAYGTYAMVAKHPGLFAAAVAISGDGDEDKARQMAKTRWRIFAGKKDIVVASTKSEKMANALKKSGASVSFTLYPHADHTESWVNAFSEPDFCHWLFSR